MDNKDLINLFFQCITIALVLSGGFFTFWRFAVGRMDKRFDKVDKEAEESRIDFKSKIDRVYARIDEHVKFNAETYLSSKVYEAVQQERKESIDHRFIEVVNLFNEKVESLRRTIEMCSKNHGSNGHTGG